MEVMHTGYFEERLVRLEGTTVADLMSTKIDSVAPDDSLIKAVSVMVDRRRFVLTLVVVGFALHGNLGYEPATVALAGAALLLLLSRLDPHEVFGEVEWPTIFFFIGLYVMIGGVVKVGIIGDLSRFVIDLTGPTAESTLPTSMVLLWFSALVSRAVPSLHIPPALGAPGCVARPRGSSASPAISRLASHPLSSSEW